MKNKDAAFLLLIAAFVVIILYLYFQKKEQKKPTNTQTQPQMSAEDKQNASSLALIPNQFLCEQQNMGSIITQSDNTTLGAYTQTGAITSSNKKATYNFLEIQGIGKESDIYSAVETTTGVSGVNSYDSTFIITYDGTASTNFPQYRVLFNVSSVPNPRDIGRLLIEVQVFDKNKNQLATSTATDVLADTLLLKDMSSKGNTLATLNLANLNIATYVLFTNTDPLNYNIFIEDTKTLPPFLVGFIATFIMLKLQALKDFGKTQGTL